MKVTVRDGVVIVGEGVKFERIRRVTGYLAGTVERFNNAKRAEEHDRVKHLVGSSEGKITLPRAV